MRRRDVVLAGAALAACASIEEAPVAWRRARPLIIAHRGASGARPEHTLSAYRLAITQGADFIEPDLVATRDGRLICRHENEISQTTDIADHREFADRRVTKIIDGVETQGWFTEDFTLAELRTLRCKERLPQLRPDNTAFDGQDPIPTLEEVWALAQEESVLAGRVGARAIGIYPELKHPTHFLNAGLSLPDLLRAFLNANGLNRREAPIFLQCFEETALRALRLQGVASRLVFLMSSEGGPYDQAARGRMRPYADYLAAPLQDIREFADGLGLEKSLVLAPNEADVLGPPSDLVRRAHEAGMPVHVWTFRAENHFLPPSLQRGDPAAGDFPRMHGDFAAEVRAFAAAGVDGLFTDFPALAAAALG